VTGASTPEGVDFALMRDGWIPSAVVFDCDGLLVDTETCWAVAEAELFARRGRTLSDAENVELIGMSVPETLVYLTERLGGGIDIEGFAKDLLELVEEIVARDARPMPGAHAVVESVSRRVPVAVASNSPRPQLEAALAAGGFGGRFGLSVAGDEISAPKPAPDVYLAACRQLGVAPERCLAFEDSFAGATAASAAGLRTIAVATVSGLTLPADLTLGSLEDPRLESWIASW
jgi:HAD superfamily hydrolase (TIGR01509 family)